MKTLRTSFLLHPDISTFPAYMPSLSLYHLTYLEKREKYAIINRTFYKVGEFMKIQESAENYLETILILQKRKGAVRSIDIANQLEYSKPSISVAMKNLRENDYIEMDAEGYIQLLDKGRRIAEMMYERHTFIAEWLTSLGVDPQIAAEDACRIEHVISAQSFEAIKKHTKLNGQAE